MKWKALIGAIVLVLLLIWPKSAHGQRSTYNTDSALVHDVLEA